MSEILIMENVMGKVCKVENGIPIGPLAIIFYCPSEVVWVIVPHSPTPGDCPLSHPPNVLKCRFGLA